MLDRIGPAEPNDISRVVEPDRQVAFLDVHEEGFAVSADLEIDVAAEDDHAAVIVKGDFHALVAGRRSAF